MRFKTFALATAVAVSALAAPAMAANFLTSGGTNQAVSNENDFRDELAALPFNYTHQTISASLSLDSAAYVTFELLGAESDLGDTFWVNGVEVKTENGESWGSVLIGSFWMNAGALDIKFTGGQDGAPGNDRFALFTNGSGAINSQSIIFGYDDTIQLNDNHDDFIVRATINAVPEASTWAMMIAGFAAVGMTVRRRSQSARVSFS